jgi:hypothetical protein
MGFGDGDINAVESVQVEVAVKRAEDTGCEGGLLELGAGLLLIKDVGQPPPEQRAYLPRDRGGS